MSTLQVLQSQRDALTAQITELAAAEKAHALAQVRAIMSEHGLTLADITPKERKTVAPKYRGLDGETWSGRGLRPTWLRAQMKLTGAGQHEFRI